MMAIQFLKRDAFSSGSAPILTANVASTTDGQRYLRYGGKTYSCSIEMAEIFLRHAQELIETGQEQLVPLRHSEGVDLLLISRSMPYWIVDKSDV